MTDSISKACARNLVFETDETLAELLARGYIGNSPSITKNNYFVARCSDGTYQVSVDADGRSLQSDGLSKQKTVYSIEDAKALTPTIEGQAFYLSAGGRSGTFAWTIGDFTSEVAADTLNGIYVPSDGDPTGASGSWVRQLNGDVHLDWFGAIGDYDLDADTGTDDGDAIDAWLKCGFTNLSHVGDKNYKTLQEHTPAKKLIINGGYSGIYQRDITLPLFNLNGADGTEFHGGDYSHNMDIADYHIDNGRLFHATVKTDDILLYNVKIFKTAQQAVDLDYGSDNFQAVLCDIRETARDGIFLVDPTNAKVSLCTFRDTGDDSIAFAGKAIGCNATNNNIDGAGTYNLGGSGIRHNGSGVISGNTITSSDLFGIIAAINSADLTAQPDDLIITTNTIKGIVKTDTVTAGIGLKTVLNVSCMNNDIEMPNVEAHAYRIYGTASEYIGITGGTAKTAKSVLYVRDGAAKKITVAGVINQDCTEHVMLEATGDIDELNINDCELRGVTPAYFFGSNYSGTISKLNTRGNRRENQTTYAFNYSNAVVTDHLSEDDQLPTGITTDIFGSSNVSSMVIKGRYGDKLSANGSVTFNATNSGLVSLGNLDINPLKPEFNIILETSLGSANYWYMDFADSQNFRIYLDVAPAQDVTFSWSVDAYRNRRVI